MSSSKWIKKDIKAENLVTLETNAPTHELAQQIMIIISSYKKEKEKKKRIHSIKERTEKKRKGIRERELGKGIPFG